MPSPLPPLDHPTMLGRSWSWVSALQAGKTTPWLQWRDDPPQAGAGTVTLPFLPAAQQLELLRRTNQVARSNGRTVPAALVERILLAGSTDRGRGDLPLLGGEPAPFGPPAVDPTGLPAVELLRVAAGLIAHDVAAATTGAVAAGGVPQRRPGRTELAGDPWAVRFASDSGWTRCLVRRRIGVVFGGDLATLAAHAWADRCLDGAGSDLSGWLQERCGADRLPPVLDLAGAAHRLAERYGASRTNVVVDLGSAPRRRFPITLPTVGLDDLELVRRVGRGLGTLLPTDQRRWALHQLLLDLAGRHTASTRLTLSVPEPFLGLLREHAERQVVALQRHRYPVLGQVNAVVPTTTMEPGEPDPDRVLALAIDVLLANDPVKPPQPHLEETT